MPEFNYKEALRLGQREYRAYDAKGKSPTLPALDDILPDESSYTTVDLGLELIPIDLIAGTKTRGRSNAFAPNFMPILEEGTEFADKWKRLSEAHITEGIRDPIKAYEYLHRYYVEEGNKRVSVLKFFEAGSIEANVTRILPERDGSEEIELYYEYVAFYKYTKINFIEFSKRGSYAALQKVLGKEVDEEWTEEERNSFEAAYNYFKTAYLQSGGDKLQTTVGDAMLSYIQVYGFQALKASDNADIRKNLGKIWEDVELKEKEEPIEVKTNPPEEKKQSLFSALVSPITEPSVLKIGFLYDGTPEKSGWVRDHEKGRLRIERVFEGRIETIAYPDAMAEDSFEVINQAIEDGCKLIFTTSPRFMPASLRAGVEHPEVIVMNCSLNKSHRYMLTYYTRMYEAKFILGALAGSLSDSGKLGYVCDYPIFGQIAGINAFAIGAQMTNPRAKVRLEWSAVKGAKEAAKALEEQDIHFISSQDTSRFLEDNRESFGLSFVNSEKRELLANPVWKWGVYYEEIVRRVLDKSLQDEYNSSNKALNYYWGMSSGVVDVVCARSIPRASRRLVEFLKESIKQNICIPFLTPLILQDGTKIGEGAKSLTLDQIINMDYLVENVVGSIPKYDEMTPMGKATVDMAGIEDSQDDIEEAGDKK